MDLNEEEERFLRAVRSTPGYNEMTGVLCGNSAKHNVANHARIVEGLVRKGAIVVDRTPRHCAYDGVRGLTLHIDAAAEEALYQLHEQRRERDPFFIGKKGRSVLKGASPRDMDKMRGLAAPNLDVAQTILNQLGQGRLASMIGAKQFMGSGAEDGHSGSLKFRFSAKSRDGSNTIVIKLMPSDTYRVEFWSIHGTSVKMKKAVDDVYVNRLRETIEEQTGLYLKL